MSIFKLKNPHCGSSLSPCPILRSSPVLSQTQPPSQPLPQAHLQFHSHSLTPLGPGECPSPDPRMKYSLSSYEKFNPWIGTYCRNGCKICDFCLLLVHISQEIFNLLAANIPQCNIAFSPQAPGFILAGEFPISNELWQQLGHHLLKTFIHGYSLRAN